MNISTARKIASELFSASDQGIREFSCMPGVSLSVSSLLGIQGFINSYSKAKVRPEELILLNGIAASMTASSKYYAAGRVTTEQKHIADTLEDMMSKYAYLHSGYSDPCNIEQAIALGGEATAHGKINRFSMGDHSLLSSAGDEVSILNATLEGFDAESVHSGISIARDRCSRKQKSIKYGKKYSVSIAYLSEETSFDNILAFAKDVADRKCVISSFASLKSDIFLGICERSKKISIYSDRLPSIDLPSETEISESERSVLSVSNFFFEKDASKPAIAIISRAKASSKKRLSALAKKHGVEICHPLEITKDPGIIVCAGKDVVSAIPAEFLRLMMRPQILKVNLPTQTKKVVYTPCEKVYDSRETLETVYSAHTELTNANGCFSDCISAILSLLVRAAYDGANTKNSLISISLNAILSSSDLSGSYAAILGIYRAITEMGISVEGAASSLTSDTPSLSVALKVRSFGSTDEILTTLSPGELFGLLAKDGEMPDFPAFRDFINGKNP